MSQKWEKLIEEGEQLLKEREFSAAAKVFEKALRIAENSGDGEMRIDSLQLLAMARRECGFAAEAEQHARRAAEITIAFEGQASREYGQSLQFLADLLIDMGELNRAEEIASVSVGIIRDSVTSHDCDSCRSALMNAYTLQLEILLRAGKFDRAKSYLSEMWKFSQPSAECKEPSQEQLDEFLQEFKENRALGKSWSRYSRTLTC
jgi:tetratricopeptide (TPR) repeat protein